jgi:PPK2 family polyphosphate:nucleotide phosphotransferase
MSLVRVDGTAITRLGEIDPDDTGGLVKAEAKPLFDLAKDRIEALQEKLYAEHGQALLVVLQAIDTGGKDGTIRNVFSGVNPQGCRVWSFKVPTAWEADHDIFWRYHQHTPGRGMITIFNRSYYEEVLVVRVKNLVERDVWERRYEQINAFEQMLTLNGTRIVKILLHISKDEQKKRLQARLDDPEKHWKFSSADLKERALWDDYQEAFEAAINRCATPACPWYVVPANNKWYRNLQVATIVANTLAQMDPQFPPAEAGLDGITIPD